MRGEFTAFETFKYLDWLLVAACVAPFILAYIIARGHELSWKPGEVTMIVGMVAFALIVLNGLILGKPGDTVDMKFEIGWFVGLLGALLLTIGGTLRQALPADAKKPRSHVRMPGAVEATPSDDPTATSPWSSSA